MRPVFKKYNQGQQMMFPVSLESKIPQNSPVRLVSQIVDKLDITEVLQTYDGGGTCAYHPRMMLKAVLFAYLSNIYSCRKIEDALKDRITFMWLSGGLEPDHNTINRFRSKHLKDAIHKIFTQVVLMLAEMGYLTLDEAYVDGTKIESRANRYTFVWRKTVEKNRAKLEAKIHKVLTYIEEGIMQDNQPDGEPPAAINSEELTKRIAEINRKNRTGEEQKEIKILEKKYLPKLKEYEKRMETLGDRNSYSKTDTDATFMRMKEDHMQNGQLKPAYNLQISTKSQFITHYDMFSNPADFLTFIPFMKGFEYRYKKMPQKDICDAGYGSEENYSYAESVNIEPYIKFNYFHKEQKQSFKNNAFISQNLYYNSEKDYLVCPMGQHMEKVGEGTRTSGNGFISHTTFYEAKNCSNCPLKCLCSSAKGNRRIEINHNLNRHKNKVRELLTSEEGLYHRSQRPIEPEAVFGQTKSNRGYNRFRHFGKDLVMMDFAIFATAFNIGKGFNKGQIMSKNGQNPPFLSKSTFLVVFVYKNFLPLAPSDGFYATKLKIAV